MSSDITVSKSKLFLTMASKLFKRHISDGVSGSLRFQNLLVVIKQTAFEEYSQVRSCDESVFSINSAFHLFELNLIETLLSSISWRIIVNARFFPLGLRHFLVKDARTSPQCSEMEKIGNAIQSSQTMCDGSLGNPTKTPS